MPDGSTMYVYGGLSNKPTVTVNGGDLIFKNHTVSNFWIPTWLKSEKKENLRKWMEYIIQDLVAGGEIFGTHVSQTYPLSDWEKALK
jgi:NADPH:quinone reductase-like Zn-dependent oxidoreductase